MPMILSDGMLFDWAVRTVVGGHEFAIGGAGATKLCRQYRRIHCLVQRGVIPAHKNDLIPRAFVHEELQAHSLLGTTLKVEVQITIVHLALRSGCYIQATCIVGNRRNPLSSGSKVGFCTPVGGATLRGYAFWEFVRTRLDCKLESLVLRQNLDPLEILSKGNQQQS